jgi:hypothetical protein
LRQYKKCMNNIRDAKREASVYDWQHARGMGRGKKKKRVRDWRCWDLVKIRKRISMSRGESLTRTQAGADLDRTVLTLSPATTRRHTPRPHHLCGLVDENFMS